MFYSRRIGRAPQLSGLYGDATSPTASTILGAAKLTGRTPSGFSLGVLDAVTERQVGANQRTIEPATNYAVVRATQDFRHGGTVLGVIATAVNRALDQWSSGLPALQRHGGRRGLPPPLPAEAATSSTRR